MFQRFAVIVFFLTLSILPFGVALQNIFLALTVLTMFYKSKSSMPFLGLSLDENLRRATLAMTGMLAVTAGSSALNLVHAPGSVTSYLLGHMSFYTFPLLFVPFFQRDEMIPNEEVRKCRIFLGFFVLIWGLVILSQWLFEWKLAGLNIVFDQAYQRARGFYSHPLTLAYVALTILPAVLHWLRTQKTNIIPWLLFGVEIAAIYLSMSRTVQAVSLIVFIWFILTLNTARVKIGLLILVAVTSITIVLTPNLISQRLKPIQNENYRQWSEEKESHYPDDRLAFWHAHWKMIQERPLFGHGAFLDAQYRRPYFEMIGLQRFKKAYEAHNQYLQIWTEGGIFALGFFIVWIFYILKWCRNFEPKIRHVGYQTLFSFLLAGVTQNAFHDSEVRYALMCVLLLGVWSQYRQIHKLSISG